MTNIVIASAARTPVGSFNGAFANTPRPTSSARSRSRLRCKVQTSIPMKWMKSSWGKF